MKNRLSIQIDDNYTYYNKHLGAVNENDSSLDILEKAQAFNSL